MEEKKDINRPLSIALVCDPIGESKAGVLVSTLRFGELLKKRGHKVIFIGAKLEGHTGDTLERGIPTYRFRGIPLPKSGGWRLAFPTTRELRRIFEKEKIDIVHITLPMSAGVIALRAARQMGLATAAHSHSQPENVFLTAPKFLQPLLAQLFNRYLAWLYSKADVLIYPTRLAHELLAPLAAQDKPAVVISNGVNRTEYRPVEHGDFLERYGIPPERTKILFVGRLFPEKRVDILIRALARVVAERPNTHLEIVGGGHLRKELEQLVDDLGISEHVTFLGLASDEDKLLAYNASDVFVLPSIAELEGMVVLEAMACGKPIIVSDAPMSAARHFVDGNGLLFKSLDEADLARQILRITEDPDTLKEMGAKNLELSARYDIDASVTKLEETYLSILKNRK